LRKQLAPETFSPALHSSLGYTRQAATAPHRRELR
jgi:hypothetical protein